MIVAVLAAVALASYLWYWRANVGSPSTTSFNPAPRGTKALYLLLEESGYPVRRWLLPYRRLREHKGIALLFGPFEAPIGRGAARALIAWVRRGNTLVYFSSLGEAQPMGLDPAEVGVLAGGAGEAALLDEIGAYRVMREGESGTLPGQARGREAWTRVVLPDLHPTAILPIAPSRVTADVDSVASTPRVPVEWMGSDGWIPLLGDRDGGEVWLGALGAGEILLGFTSTPAQNRMMDERDNAVLALGIVERFLDRGEEILFIERVHGFGVEEEAGGAPFDPGGLRWLILHAALLATAYLFAKGRRLGPVVPLERPSPRSSVELAESLADLYRRADVRGDVWRVEAERFRRLARARLWAGGVGRPGNARERLLTLARTEGKRAEELARAVLKGTDPPADLKPRDLLLLDSIMGRMEGSEEG